MVDADGLYLFHEGTNYHSYRMLGAHPAVDAGKQGVRFAVWAPHALAVAAVGDFNGWDDGAHPLRRIERSGIWTGFVPGARSGDLYKYAVRTSQATVWKADPCGFSHELRPGDASRVCDLSGYAWRDAGWLKERQSVYDRPVSIYEVHFGSWRRGWSGEFRTYRQLADELVSYIAAMGYTHIEILPVMEHPLDASWGYQITGYYAVTSRYGDPHDFMYFVDECHRNGIGVILDWVPGHFCKNSHGLWRFDGTPLYEYADDRRGENQGWGTANFDHGRPEVRSFLISNAVFWFDVYHIDGLRVDAVAGMLYRDYGREQGDWTPNEYGGRENCEAVSFLQQLNTVVFGYYPQAMMIAEESTAWPLVTRPTDAGGLGFNFKWNMGWMNDVLRYMTTDPVYRQWSHRLLTFSLLYAFSENYILPFSHDEVVHLKKSMLAKMPGDSWRQFANLRALYGYFCGHPGKKLLFMGGEFGQYREWSEERELDWNLLDNESHRRLQQYVRELNRFYRQEPALWELDIVQAGFEWIDCDNVQESILVFLRRACDPEDFLIVVCNFTPVVRNGYRIGVPRGGNYREVFNSDAVEFGGTGQTNSGRLAAECTGWHNRPCSLVLTVPPLAVVFLKPVKLENK